jgi:NADH-quinone oxidoreductase subunit M
VFIRSMHNRVGPRVRSYDVRPRHALVLAPLVVAILALAFYPQVALKKSERTVAAIVKRDGGPALHAEARP